MIIESMISESRNELENCEFFLQKALHMSNAVFHSLYQKCNYEEAVEKIFYICAEFYRLYYQTNIFNLKLLQEIKGFLILSKVALQKSRKGFVFVTNLILEDTTKRRNPDKEFVTNKNHFQSLLAHKFMNNFLQLTEKVIDEYIIIIECQLQLFKQEIPKNERIELVNLNFLHFALLKYNERRLLCELIKKTQKCNRNIFYSLAKSIVEKKNLHDIDTAEKILLSLENEGDRIEMGVAFVKALLSKNYQGKISSGLKSVFKYNRSTLINCICLFGINNISSELREQVFFLYEDIKREINRINDGGERDGPLEFLDLNLLTVIDYYKNNQMSENNEEFKMETES